MNFSITLLGAISGVHLPKCLQYLIQQCQLVGGIVITYHPVGYDIKYFPELFKRISELANIRTVVLDKGYDAEYLHELIHSVSAISIIPARGDYVLIWHTSCSYKK